MAGSNLHWWLLGGAALVGVVAFAGASAPVPAPAPLPAPQPQPPARTEGPGGGGGGGGGGGPPSLSARLLASEQARQLLWFQALAYAADYSNDTPDGLYGPRTQAVIAAVQTRNNELFPTGAVPVDGVFSTPLLGMLNGIVWYDRPELRPVPLAGISADAVRAMRASIAAVVSRPVAIEAA